ncbi:NAD-dependent glycerol-3-phosphate dehydrogenase [Basidiobolus meristosporus CBS 931.73]|uniref:Glycerol-3-phosphate dehydrogenase [NAD(+)] n=1 Tax=Basidiobolus meristosporus CBS 931.73 TaxID=1314790 RepID=A0A1Y1Y6T4_9FUNG|nr:NAD-dependent glycerol-3-phosphate dehydrogenase [Basidiobolus meristosporus CBS 931.73]|eukprot:ORX93294.1 NAD-dependent glycerol-3-phosphate dehydrogenase [Basidiobolus meristosporus CBS 931.73]
MTQEKVALIGSGNWGSAIAKIVGSNVLQNAEFDKEVRMWVFEEMVDGRKLTEIINNDHENVKYLPGIKLPESIVAVPDLLECVRDATTLIFVVPHQFLKGICKSLLGNIRPDARAISLIKGLDASADGMRLFSQVIADVLNIEVSVLSGANIANEVAEEMFCESTIGSKRKEDGEVFYKLFNTPYFRITVVEDVAGVEICGALKNIVAVGAGFIDGLKLGENTKAAIMRIGLMEMKRFACTFWSGVKEETFYESCGVADLITTCAGGRNRKVAEAHVVTGRSFDELEREMLNGQKLQGTLAAHEVHDYLKAKNMTAEFPLFTRIYQIVYENTPASSIVEGL